MSADDVASFNGSLCGTEGGYRRIVDGNNIEVDGVGNRSTLTVIDEVVEACNAVEVFVRCVGVGCLLYTSPSPRDRQKSRMPSSA